MDATTAIALASAVIAALAFVSAQFTRARSAKKEELVEMRADLEAEKIKRRECMMELVSLRARCDGLEETNFKLMARLLKLDGGEA